MLLHIRNGERLYEIDVPDNCRVERSPKGRPVLLIPGPTPTDTATWLPAPLIIDAARSREYGLDLTGERFVGSNAPPAGQSRAAG